MANIPHQGKTPTSMGDNTPIPGSSFQNRGNTGSDIGLPAPGGIANDSNTGGREKDLVSRASEKLLDTAEHQKMAGADFVGGIAGAVRRAAGEFEGQVPQAAEYIRYAADQMDNMSDAVRRRDVGQIVSELQSFARQQPTAFLGATFIAGFAAMRFLKSSSSAAERPHAAMRSQGAAPGMARYGDFGERTSGTSSLRSDL